MDTKQSGMRAAALHAGHCNLPSVTLRVCVAAGLFAALAGCMGYVPGRQAYWDAKVREMCEKDGGVKIFEKLRISKAEIELLGKVDGKIGVPIKALAHPNAPAYEELKITDLRKSNPRVSRSESTIVRRADQVVVARWVVYARSGGDFPTGFSEGTNFVCPDFRTITSELQKLFIVDGDSKCISQAIGGCSLSRGRDEYLS